MHLHRDHELTTAPGLLRRLRTTAVAVGVLGILGLVLLWPRGDAPEVFGPDARRTFVDATVTDVARGPCPAIEVDAVTTCQLVTAEVTSGSRAGDAAHFVLRDIDAWAPELSRGDRVVLRYTPTAPPPHQYSFEDLHREGPLVVLGLLFVLVVLAVGRWVGLRALAGLVISIGIVALFLVPSMSRGNNALAVAIVAAVLIAFCALYLAHGVNALTTVALLGTLASLLLIVGLTSLFVALAGLTGLADESAQILRLTADVVDPRWLLIAGTVIGALGVLDDVTVTQVSAVAELRRANPTLGGLELYRRGLRIGRDHVAATVNTLVLAYAGASLPLFLFFSQTGDPIRRTLGREVIAVEVVRMLVGSIGLVLAVPVTTALAAYVLDRGAPVTSAEPVPEPADSGPAWEDFAPRQA